MTGGHARRLRLTLTIGQMMKLVIFGGGRVALPRADAAAGGGGRGELAGGRPDGIRGHPAGHGLVAFLVVRPGPFRDWLVLGLLVTPLASALGAAVYLRAWGASIRGGADPDFLLMVILLLGVPLFLIVFHIVPGRCPGCWRSWLLPDGTFRPEPGSSLRRVYRCGSCKRRYWKHRNLWNAVPLDLSPPIRQQAAR